MHTIREFKTIVRTDSVGRLLRALEDAGVTRFWVSHVHAVGSGVDPTDVRFSMEEETAYTEKAKVEFLAPADRQETLMEVVRKHCASGHHGDGVVSVSDVASVVNVRTGDRGTLALL